MCFPALQVSHSHLGWAEMVPPQSVMYMATSVSASLTQNNLIPKLLLTLALAQLKVMAFWTEKNTLFSLVSCRHCVCLPLHE